MTTQAKSTTQTREPTVEDKKLLAAVRLRSVNERDYFASALFAMTIVPTPGLGTMAVDKWGRVYADPDIIGAGKKWSVENAAWVLIHEVGHWLRKHHERSEPIVRNEKDLEAAICLANLAQDCEINDDLHREGASLPDGGGVTPEKFGMKDGKIWEEYYDELKKQVQSGRIKLIRRNCGSAAHGIPQEYELPPPGGSGKDQQEGIGEAEGDLLRRVVAREIQGEVAKGRGDVPAGWKRWAEALLAPPEVAWEKELAALVRNAVTMAMGAVDYSYSKPSRRGMFSGVIMAALRRPTPHAAVVVDTSGSMSETDLAAALREIRGIMRGCGQRAVPVVCCDAAAAPVQRVSQSLQLDLIGGGGTDMGVGMSEAAKLPHTDIIIVLTDALTPWPAEPPRGKQFVVGIIAPKSEGKQLVKTVPSYMKRVVLITPKSAATADAA